MAKYIVATDLDGTLFSKSNNVSNTNFETLKMLGKKDIIRILATGRSFYSCQKNLNPNLPIDYLVSSSGCGIFQWQTSKLLKDYCLNKNEIIEAVNIFLDLKIDFSIQKPVPQNHEFVYYKMSEHNSDFERRLSIYEGFADKFDPYFFDIPRACQLIGIVKGKKAINLYESCKISLPNLKVIRSTSPIDGESLWIEIYPKQVSKANGILHIASLLNILPDNIVAIGNDYNDLDMLNLSKHAFVVQNSPKDIKKHYKVVPSNDEDGFSEAVKLWLNAAGMI